MIGSNDGKIAFADGLLIAPHAAVRELKSVAPRKLPLLAPGLQRFDLDLHSSEYGIFSVEVVCNLSWRIHLAMLVHEHPFYEAATAQDTEREIYHQEIIVRDLGGQNEFSWGRVFCRLDAPQNRNVLIVAYAGPLVGGRHNARLGRLIERADRPEEG